MRSLILLILSFSSLVAVAATDPFTEAEFIAGLGAGQLALQKIEQQQSRPELSADDWLRWERLRIDLYSRTEAWQSLIQRIDTQQQNIPLAARNWFATQQVAAWLALGDGKAARLGLRRLIWQAEISPPTASLIHWREQLIRSYLLDKQANAAHIAMLRHNQDYRAQANATQTLRASVLLQAGRAKDAADIVANNKSAEAQSLYLLAALRSASLPATTVIKQAKKRIKAKGLDKAVRLRLWAAVAEASLAEADTGNRVVALENIFSETRASQLDDGLITLQADALWEAYSAHAQAWGNRGQLLIGDDKQWFAQAAKYASRPVRQRAFYALLSETARDEAARLRAHEELIRSLQKQKTGPEIMRRLYLEGSRYADITRLPAIARYTLLEQALTESDVSLASSLLQGLQQAPKGVAPLLWEMRRARVFIMAGDVERGSEVLAAVLKGEAVFDKAATDRFMQVVFDLQTLNEHEQALRLFEKLQLQTGDPQLQREILYWMADSRKAQQQYAEAAVLYLRSADVPGQILPDLWAQSALYQAAEALTEAGLIRDARRIYSQLLNVSKDEARRAVLQRRLQQLWLRDNKG